MQLTENQLREHVILVRYGEIALKGLNRHTFIDMLVKNIRNTLGHFESVDVKKVQGRIVVHVSDAELSAGMEAVSRVFGVVSLSPATVVPSEMAAIEPVVREEADKAPFDSFKVCVKRSDKRFPMKSPDIARHLGGVVLKHYDGQGKKVKMKGADREIWVEVREQTYVYSEFIKGRGGLPVGCSGKAALLLSGGIDSPVAGYMMAKRGIRPIAVYFHSFPFTSDRAKEKVIDLAKILTQYTGRMSLYVVPFTDIQTKIVEVCPERQTTLIIRRFMMRIAEKIAEQNGALSLITGESLGQVASQTQEGLAATGDVVAMPVLRPLIGMDKQEIVEIAQDIGTFETSILPYEDCCTIFVPKHPETRPQLDKIRAGEAAMMAEAEAMIADAVAKAEVVRL
ncbi:tRNA uracil 4-sulfurtransferase ThiI [Pseudoramibacter alactolyticus]|jgi:thiamine biosynthesis protein ThiI|uniref:tRNA uracil 4-sulfurtransferase ThiI n=1 Tax=Pseudoramibacter alactolyticus TaxID=113287 RepID=UPI002356D6DC|nr:tRNA uracil 4-sulfurtransferase ThiI [Pseudoramibacter alactolyticus]MBM6968304.1 tRNA 4-thiouridine(8) synthase ThiI [Pseudoramibacter alactolyticus]